MDTSVNGRAVTFTPVSTIPAALSFVGGYVDAGSYIVAHSFSGHVTGNMILVAISLAESRYSSLAVISGSLSFFLLATYAGQRLRTQKYSSDGSIALALSLGAEILLIALSPLPYTHTVSRAAFLFIACLSLAMGIQNGAYSKDETVSVHTTYLTGTLSALLLSLAKQNSTGSLTTQSLATRRSIWIIVRLWGCFVLGAFTAGWIVPRLGAKAMWVAEIPLLIALFAEVTYSQSMAAKRMIREPQQT